MQFVPMDDVRKGVRVRLLNGWFATVLDNKVNSHTRLCEVEGIVTEMGSVYSVDIVQALDKTVNEWKPVKHTEGQIKAAQKRMAAGF